MNVFQVLGVLFLLLLSLMTVVAAFRRRVALVPALCWVMLWLAAAIAILIPRITSVVARFLGIDRGADLVFYCGILAMLVGFFFGYVKLRRIERNITVLVRRIAIYDARQERPAGERVAAEE